MRSPRLASIGLALVGLGISAYLTAVHFSRGQVPLLCSASGLVNCEQVTTSPESMVGPVPVAALGIVWYVVMLALLSHGEGLLPRRHAVARLAWAGAGVAVVFYLIYAELFLINAICVWCSIVHLIVILLFLASVGEYTRATPAEDTTTGGAVAEDATRNVGAR